MSDSQSLEQQLSNTTAAPERLPLFLQLGAVYEAAGDVRNMARCFYEASAIDPRSLLAVQGARRAYLRARKWEGAIAWFQAELRLQPDVEARAALLNELGDLRRNELNDPEGAQLEYGKASQLRADARAVAAPAAPAPADVPLRTPPVPAEAPPPDALHERPRVQPEIRENSPGTRSVPVWSLVLVVLLGGGAGAYWKFKPAPLCPQGQMHRRDAFLLPETLSDVAFAEGCWVDTRRVGVHRFFNDAGVETALIPYQAGLPEGAARWIAHDGGHQSGQTQLGLQTGEWTTQTPDGVIVSKAMYRNGLLEGPERVLFPDGGLQISAFWEAGKQEGEWSQYYEEDGKIWMRGNFKAGTATGKWQRFDHAGAFVWVTPMSAGPRALRSDSSLFAGRPLAWWNLRVAELRSDAARAPGDAERKARLELTLHRARLCDLEVDLKTQMLKPVVVEQ